MTTLETLLVPILPDGKRFLPDLKAMVHHAQMDTKLEIKPNIEHGLAFSKLKDESGKAGKEAGHHFGTSFGSAMKGAIALVSAGALINFSKGLIADARESARVAAVTTNVIKSTGEAAGISAKQVGDLATAISNKTGADDEAIQSGQNLLLTFTNIKNGVGPTNDIFNQASKTLVDMTAAMNNGDVSASALKGSSIQLGKALNDPVKGISALTKVGVTFTDQQKEQIKSLVKSGDTMDAQKVILKELNKEFGGTAAAATDPMKKLQVAIGNVRETLGSYLLPVVDKFGNWMLKIGVPLMNEWIGKFADFVKIHFPPFRDAVKDLYDKYLPSLKSAFYDAKDGVQTAWSWIKKLYEYINDHFSKDQQKTFLEVAAAIFALKKLGVFNVGMKIVGVGKSLVDMFSKGEIVIAAGGMQAAGDTMGAAALAMQRAADTMAGSSLIPEKLGKGAGVGEAALGGEAVVGGEAAAGTSLGALALPAALAGGAGYGVGKLIDKFGGKKLTGAGRAGASIGGGALAGAAIGTALLPGIGTAVGAVAGGIGGALSDPKATAKLWSESYEGFMNKFGSPLAKWFRTEPKKLWEEVSKPVKKVFDDIKHTITSGFDGWWKSHGDEVKQLWKEVWDSIKAVPVAVWKVLKAVITSKQFSDVMSDIVTSFKVGWDIVKGVFKVAWAILETAAKIFFASLKLTIKVAWDVIVGIFSVALDLLTGHWGKAWEDIKKVGHQVWNAIAQFFTGAWGDLKKGWDKLWGGIKDTFHNIWDDIKKDASDGLNGLINIVNGAIHGINKVTGVFHVPKIPDIPKVNLARGGLLEGPGTETSDSIPIMGSKGEFMHNAEAVKYYGVDYMKAVNERRAPRMAHGGSIDEIIGAAQKSGISFPYPTDHQLTGGGHATNSLHYKSEAVDFSPGAAAMMQLAQYFSSNYGKALLEEIHTPLGYSIKNGRHVSPIDAANHYNHVHIGAAPGFTKGILGKIGSFFGGIISAGLNDVVSPLAKPIISKLKGMDAPFGPMVAGGMQNMIDAMIAKFGGNTSSAGGGGSVASGAAQMYAQSQLPKYGWGPDQMSPLIKLWDRESGWNYKAYNPNGGATGIPQALPGSKMASAGADWKTNPETQIRWGLGYIKNRYGSPASAWSQDEARSPHWYDQGGKWPSGTVGYNNSGKTETVRTHEQELALANKELNLSRKTIQQLTQAMMIAAQNHPISVAVPAAANRTVGIV